MKFVRVRFSTISVAGAEDTQSQLVRYGAHFFIYYVKRGKGKFKNVVGLMCLYSWNVAERTKSLKATKKSTLL